MTFKNNNPANLRYVASIQWDGQTGSDGIGFAAFDTLPNGLRAAALNLLAQQTRHGHNCVEDIIAAWAPPAENDTVAYVKDVSDRMGVRPEEFVDLFKHITLTAMLSAVCHHETGEWIDTGALAKGIELAYAAFTPKAVA